MSPTSFKGRELFKTTTFRLTLAVVAAVVLCVVGNLVFFYYRFVDSETVHFQRVLTQDASIISTMPEPDILRVLQNASTVRSLPGVDFSGLFDENLTYLAGDIPSWPEGLQISQKIQQIDYAREKGRAHKYLLFAMRLPSKHVVIFGASQRRVSSVRASLLHATLFSLLPMVAFALCVGLYLSHRALARVGALNEAIERIMTGDLSGRLPTHDEQDDLEKLAGSVNRMLDRIESLMTEIRSVGNDIAHDLRTPLARVKVRLERGLKNIDDGAQVRDVIENAMRDLEQCFSMITAILRVAELEDGRRRAGFATHDLRNLVAEIVELYEPMCEGAHLQVTDQTLEDAPLLVDCDRDLLNEVLANLLDNAIKFTPAGGAIEVSALLEADRIVLRVADTGIGIAEEERAAVVERFYRSDKSRHIPGSGLGLSLVMAILRLHGSALKITVNREGRTLPGTVFQMAFRRHEEEELEPTLLDPVPQIS